MLTDRALEFRLNGYLRTLQIYAILWLWNRVNRLESLKIIGLDWRIGDIQSKILHGPESWVKNGR